MVSVHERTHQHLGGTLVATVIQDEDGQFRSAVVCCPKDESKIVVDLGVYSTLASAQQGADRHVELIGHECTESCDEWSDSMKH